MYLYSVKYMLYLIDAWSHHAVAHSLYYQCKLVEGLEWMYPLHIYWNECCSFMISHNWWHIGLFLLDACMYDEVIKLLIRILIA